MRIIPIIIFTFLCLLFFAGLFNDPKLLKSTKIGKDLPYFNILTIDNDVLSSQDLKGDFALINVFASWCDGCRVEHEFLTKLSEEGVIVYGIDYKDSVTNVKRWLNSLGNPYKKVGLDKNGDLGIELGVYGTPETFLIDPNGKIIYRHVGVLNIKDWDENFIPKIKKLKS